VFLIAQPCHAITIQIDYTYDTPGFFATQASRDRMSAAAVTLGDLLEDHLDAISPTGTDSWSAGFFHPSQGGLQTIPNLVVPEDTVIVYVGGRSLGGSKLAETNVGLAFASGSPEFQETANSRGQGVTVGAGASDFGPWGASISFSTTASWNFEAALPAAGQYDFYSAALHELGHALGFGTSDAWVTRVANQAFQGADSVAEFGAPVPLSAGGDHWASGTTSFGSQAAMNATIVSGLRRALSPLDLAALSDIGWQVDVSGLSTGDLNFDGLVDISDLVKVADAWLTPNLQGDANHDRRVDIGDVTFIAENWLNVVGPRQGSGLSSQPAVPEPSAIVLVACGLVGSLAFYHRGAGFCRKRRVTGARVPGAKHFEPCCQVLPRADHKG